MTDRNDRPISEDFMEKGAILTDKIKDLIQAGNVRRLILRRPNGKVLADISLTAGIGIAGLITLLAPLLAALAAMAALLTQFRVEIQREPDPFAKRRDHVHNDGQDDDWRSQRK